MSITEQTIEELKNLNIPFIKKEINKLYFKFPRKIGYLFTHQKMNIFSKFVIHDDDGDNFSNSQIYEKSPDKFYETSLSYIYKNISINVNFYNIFNPLIIYKETNNSCDLSTTISRIQNKTLKAIAFDAVQTKNGNILIDYIKEKVLS